MTTGVYGLPPHDLVAVERGAIQFSPLIPGSAAIEDAADESLDAFALLAPPGTLERRYVLAQALRALKTGGRLTALAPKDKGGTRLGKELAAFGGVVGETGKRHHRICVVTRPPAPSGLEAAIAAGAPQMSPGLDLWTQPGVFSWDRLDPGSALLAQNLPALKGSGADLGCGIGVLARVVLSQRAVGKLIAIDLDRRAVEAARRNLDDPRVEVVWADIRAGEPAPSGLDFVVMNPPFHDGGREDRALGQAFIARAAAMLKTGGVCLIVANRHLPYEAAMEPLFTRVTLRAETSGYKVYEAKK